MNYDILIDIILTLIAKRKVNANSLAQKYNISVRTVFRYFVILSASGFPILTTRGRNGCTYIPDSYKLPYNIFTNAEYEVTIQALKSLNAQIKSVEIENALAKISATKNITSENNIVGNIIIDAAPWGDAVNYKSKIDVINSAINDSFCISIEYHDRNASVTTRIIEPHTLAFKQGIWYVYAFCRLRNEFRFFKVGRIKYAHKVDEKFERKEIDRLPFDNWYDSSSIIDCEFEISKSALPDVEEWLGIENISIINGTITASVRLPYEQSLIGKILSYGNGIKVISPISLKEEITKTCKEILGNN